MSRITIPLQMHCDETYCDYMHWPSHCSLGNSSFNAVHQDASYSLQTLAHCIGDGLFVIGLGRSRLVVGDDPVALA
jgi:hypothetical protein